MKSSGKNLLANTPIKLSRAVVLFSAWLIFISSCALTLKHLDPLRYFQKSAGSIRWVSGRGEIHFEGKERPAIPASFIINADPRHMRLDFINPFGMVTAVLVAGEHFAILKTADSTERKWLSSEAMFHELTGIPLSSKHLFNILTGRILAEKEPDRWEKKNFCAIWWNLNGAPLKYTYRCSTGEPLYLTLTLPEYTITAESYVFVNGTPVPQVILIKRGSFMVKVRIQRISFSPPANAEELFRL